MQGKLTNWVQFNRYYAQLEKMCLILRLGLNVKTNLNQIILYNVLVINGVFMRNF